MKLFCVLLLFLQPGCTSKEKNSSLWTTEINCSSDSDCIITSKWASCCSGCWTEPDDLIAVSLKGFSDKNSIIKNLQCKNCPHINCPVKVSCINYKPFCLNSKCRIKNSIPELCSDGISSKVHWSDLTACNTDTDCFTVEKAITCCQNCSNKTQQLTAVNRSGFNRYSSFKMDECRNKSCSTIKCESRTEQAIFGRCVNNRCLIDHKK